MKKLLLITGLLAALLCWSGAVAEEIPLDEAHFPDPFLRYCVQANFDADGDGRLSEEERNEVEMLTIRSASLTTLKGLELFPNLEALICTNNGLTELGVAALPALVELDCSDNPLTALDLSGSPRLEALRCENCRLTSLNLEQNDKLRELRCANNRLACLNLGEKHDLATVACDGCVLKAAAPGGAFDLSALPGFQLSRLQYVSGGALNGSVLTVNETQRITYRYDCGSGFARAFALDLIVMAPQPAGGMPIDSAHFPDAAFRAWVLENLDADRNGALSEEERIGAESIALDGKSLSSLKGLEYFPALEALSCQECGLKSLDVRPLPMLKSLNCGKNALTALNLTGNPRLEELWCRENLLSALDLSRNSALKQLDCYGNLLKALDVSGNPELEYLSCGDCRFACLDLSHNPALTGLYGNQRMLMIEAVNGKFDLSVFPGFDVNRASHWQGGTVNGVILTVPDMCDVTYDYDCGGGHSIACRLTVNIVDDPDPVSRPGNVTGDGMGTVDGRDLIRLARYLAGENVSIHQKAADVNADGAVDGRDLIRLARYLTGENVELKRAP